MRISSRIAILLCFFATRLFAIIDANSPTNTSDPGDGSPWGNVGHVNGASGIYIGDGWVLTANHVGAGTITFDIGTFTADGQTVRLQNPDNSATDMLLFHLTLTPSLSALTLSSSTPGISSLVDMEGFGYIAGSAQKTYSTPSGTYTGFDWSGSQSKGWGTNRIQSGVSTQVDLGNGALQVFSVNFSQTLQTANEGQAATGDSGGAIFFKNGTTWELAGMIDAIGTLTDQPANTAVYGDFTNAADIATYRSQIVSAVPEPATSALLVFGGGAIFFAALKKRKR
jgi:hypothetical protein